MTSMVPAEEAASKSHDEQNKPDWITEQFTRSSARFDSLPAWARPVVFRPLTGAQKSPTHAQLLTRLALIRSVVGHRMDSSDPVAVEIELIATGGRDA